MRHNKGVCNSYIREAIASGLRYEGGKILLPSGREVTPTYGKTGYGMVSLGPENRRRSFTYGRLVCWLVHGPPPTEKHQVDHINRIRSDDRPENLRWVSAANARNISEESRKRVADNCRRIRKTIRGEAHGSAKLSDAQIEQIRSCTQTQRQIAAAFGITQSHVSRIKLWKRRQ